MSFGSGRLRDTVPCNRARAGVWCVQLQGGGGRRGGALATDTTPQMRVPDPATPAGSKRHPLEHPVRNFRPPASVLDGGFGASHRKPPHPRAKGRDLNTDTDTATGQWTDSRERPGRPPRRTAVRGLVRGTAVRRGERGRRLPPRRQRRRHTRTAAARLPALAARADGRRAAADAARPVVDRRGVGVALLGLLAWFIEPYGRTGEPRRAARRRAAGADLERRVRAGHRRAGLRRAARSPTSCSYRSASTRATRRCGATSPPTTPTGGPSRAAAPRGPSS